MGLPPVFGFAEEENFKNIAQLIKEGFIRKIMVSQDTVLSPGRDRFSDLSEELTVNQPFYLSFSINPTSSLKGGHYAWRPHEPDSLQVLAQASA